MASPMSCSSCSIALTAVGSLDGWGGAAKTNPMHTHADRTGTMSLFICVSPYWPGSQLRVMSEQIPDRSLHEDGNSQHPSTAESDSRHSSTRTAHDHPFARALFEKIHPNKVTALVF